MGGRRRPRGGTGAAGLSVVVVAVNLRPAVAGVGPVLPELRADLPLSGAGAAVLTTVPVLCFGLLATVAPRLARRFGIEPVLVGAMAALAAGALGRVLGGAAGAVRRHGRRRRGDRDRERPAAAADQARLPGPDRADDGRVHDGRERVGRGRRRARRAAGRRDRARLAGLRWGSGRCRRPSRRWPGCPGFAATPAPRRAAGRFLAAARSARVAADGVLRTSVAVVLRDSRLVAVDVPRLRRLARDAGFLLSLSGLVQIPVSLALPGLADRARHQVGYVVGGTALIGAGLAGVLLAPMAAPYLWVVLLGTGQGACFALGLNLFVRAPAGHRHRPGLGDGAEHRLHALRVRPAAGRRAARRLRFLDGPARPAAGPAGAAGGVRGLAGRDRTVRE